MKTEVVIPEIGESVTEGTITVWLKKEGDFVLEGEDLFELETDKATLAIPSPAAGVLSIRVKEGSEVTIGQVVADLETDKVSDKIARLEGKPVEAAHTKTKSEREPEIESDKKVVDLKESKKEKSTQLPLSPAVRHYMEEHGLKPEEITGTGKDGRITKKDVLQIIEEKKQLEGKRVAAGEPAGSSMKTSQARKPEIAPLAAVERQTRVTMSTIRRRTAERLVASQQSAAHLTTFNEVDMAKILEIREQYRESFEKKHGVRLGFMSFFVKACCSALAEFPEVNAYIEGDEIVYNNFYDIGIAVSTERGLLVPVLRDADRMNFAEIEGEVRMFAEKARNKKLSIDNLQGGTFTITNGGVFGSLLSTPIPNPPQTAILGMHKIQKRPVVVNDEVVIRPMMYVALTYDHRLIDGRVAVSFLVKVKELLEDPQRLLLDI
jgi:2-oxoglutarate dehydrogenase E2 component (dihydrolipoamide succinyltransferase)